MKIHPHTNNTPASRVRDIGVGINAWILLLIFIILYFVFQIREDVLRYYSLVSENQLLLKNIKDIENNNLGLAKKISSLLGDQFVESLARERLNLIKKGEIAYKVCRSKSDKI